jgi:hypothetical protein
MEMVGIDSEGEWAWGETHLQAITLEILSLLPLTHSADTFLGFIFFAIASTVSTVSCLGGLVAN